MKAAVKYEQEPNRIAKKGKIAMLTNPLSRYFLSYGTNHFTIDRPFQMALEYCGLPEIHFDRLTELGHYTSTALLEITDYIDRFSHPHLQMWDINSRRFDWVRLNPAHRQALADLMKTGIIYRTFTEKAPWQLQFPSNWLDYEEAPRGSSSRSSRLPLH